MADAYVHLEKGDCCIDRIREFLNYAFMRGVDVIFFPGHTHILWNVKGCMRKQECLKKDGLFCIMEPW